MDDAALGIELMEALALDWLHGHATPITLHTFAHARGRPVADVRRATVSLQLAGAARFHPTPSPYTQQDVAMVLSRHGQCVWVQTRAELAFPGTHAQLTALRQVLQGRPGGTEDEVAQQLHLTRGWARQLIMMLRALDQVYAAVDAHGQFIDLRLREPKT
ncbi:hypothetical protein [Deinococcus yunweiensis]|uniref:hypothetical protein n=1 Tax=Deinococcus yunweiensis TaxID=367282 RepID=UPI00398EEC9E